MGKRLLHVGCGAIGSYTVSGLPIDLASLALCDMDVVAKENIGIADFLPSEVGQKKVSVLARKIRQKHPLLRITEIDGEVSAISPTLVDSFDVVSAAVDNDKAAYSVCRIVAQSVKKPSVVFANCDSRTGSAQIRTINFNANQACLGCNRTRERWETPLSDSHGCAQGAMRATGEAAQLAAALQVNVLADILNNRNRAEERAGESLIVDPTSGVALKTRLVWNPDCPAFYHYYERTLDHTTSTTKTVRQITLKETLDTIAEVLGVDAFVELGERRCSDGFFCPSCDKEVEVLRLCSSPPRCSCGTLLRPTGEFRRIRVALRESDISNVTLGELGFPEGDVLLAVGKKGYLYFSTEISESCKRAVMV
jgi:molybdopterin/thiamine biosynthesis adenylyltransferase